MGKIRKRNLINKIDENMYYCAYGSNINLEQMKYRCPNSTVIGVGYLKDWMLLFNIHADIFPVKGCKTPVLVWKIDKNDWKTLDMYEGYPNYYVREKVIVTMQDGEHEAIAYVMADKRRGICPPYEHYFNGILEGYDSNNMDTDYLFEALDYSYEHETKFNKYYHADGRKIM